MRAAGGIGDRRSAGDGTAIGSAAFGESERAAFTPSSYRFLYPPRRYGDPGLSVLRTKHTRAGPLMGEQAQL